VAGRKAKSKKEMNLIICPTQEACIKSARLQFLELARAGLPVTYSHGSNIVAVRDEKGEPAELYVFEMSRIIAPGDGN
jgi:hypothetical protein